MTHSDNLAELESLLFEDTSYDEFKYDDTKLLCNIPNTSRIRAMLINKIIKGARKYHYMIIEEKPKFSELLELLPRKEEDIIAEMLESEIKANKHILKSILETSPTLPVTGPESELFTDAERNFVRGIYFALGSDIRRGMFRIAKHYALYKNLMLDPMRYTRDMLDMEKLEAIDAIQGDKVELSDGGTIPFDKFYDNIFRRTFLNSDSDYYTLADIRTVYRESTDEKAGTNIVKQYVYDEKRSIKEFTNVAYIQALSSLCRAINDEKVGGSSEIKIYSFSKMKNEGKLWLHRPEMQVGQLIFIFGHFGIVDSIQNGNPICYLSNGEYLTLDYAAYGAFSVAMVKIVENTAYSVMRDRIMKLHEEGELERLQRHYKLRV